MEPQIPVGVISIYITKHIGGSRPKTGLESGEIAWRGGQSLKKGPDRENSLQRFYGKATLCNMEKNFEPLKDRLRVICDRLDPEEQVSFRPLIDDFTGATSEFQRIMRDLGKYGKKIGDGSTFAIYREVQNLFDRANRGG